jgi:hypothetical protein
LSVSIGYSLFRAVIGSLAQIRTLKHGQAAAAANYGVGVRRIAIDGRRVLSGPFVRLCNGATVSHEGA